MTHSTSYSDDWEFADWKGFQKVLFRLQKRIFKAIKEEDKAKAKRLQKLVLSSYAARMLAIRQVSQLNTGNKTAGIDGVKSLTFKQRFDLEAKLREGYKTWKHQGVNYPHQIIDYDLGFGFPANASFKQAQNWSYSASRGLVIFYRHPVLL